MDEVRAAYDEVYVYSTRRPGFLLQHIIDAFAVQSATVGSKRIGVIFGLIGLCLHVEKNFSGTQVQKVHTQLGRNKREWPSIDFPKDRGAITVLNVLKAPEGTERDLAIHHWCRSVWLAFAANRDIIVELLREYQVM
jgi:hypothetical protein